jgi:uncharacterized protein
MSLVVTGRDEARLNEAADDIRRASGVNVETVVADLSTPSGVSALLDHVGGRPIEVLVNNAGFGSYGPFVEGDPDREADEVAVDVGAVITLARAFLPGMLARGSGGILNVASTIAFQPAPYQAVYGRARRSCCPSARHCGARPVGPVWPSPRSVRAPPARASSMRWAPPRRAYGDLQPARGTRARDRGRATGAGQGQGRGHPRPAEQGDRGQWPVRAAPVARADLGSPAPPGQHRPERLELDLVSLTKAPRTGLSGG